MVPVEALRSCELFEGLSDAELEELAAIAREEVCQPGELICSDGEEANRLFILQQGRARLEIHLRSSAEPSRDVTIEEVEPGRIIGWSSLVKQRRFTVSARATEPVTLLAIKSADLNALFERNTHMGFVVMKRLASVVACRLRYTRERLDQNVGES